jgi:hypothetical protein
LEKIGWTDRIAVNESVRPCEQFEFREGAVTMVTEVSVSDTLKSQTALLFDGSQTSPVCPSGKSDMWMKISMERWGNDTDRGKQEHWKKNPSQCHFVHHKSHIA